MTMAAARATHCRHSPGRRPVALGEALSMLHWVRCTASLGTAAVVIKTDQYDQLHQDCGLLFLSVLFIRRLTTDTALRPKDTNLILAEGQLFGPRLLLDVQVFIIRVMTTW